MSKRTVHPLYQVDDFIGTDVTQTFTGDDSGPTPGRPIVLTNNNNTKTIYGATAPNGATGADGDTYVRTSNNTVYGPKTNGAWGSPVSIIGQAGPQGVPGSDTGRRLALATSGTNFTMATATPTDITGVALAATHSARPSVIEAGGWTLQTTTTATITIAIYDVTASTIIGYGGATVNGGGFNAFPTFRGFIPGQTPGTVRNYKLQVGVSAGSVTIYAATNTPTWLEVTER